MFLGLRTVIYHVSDLSAAKDWYAAALGIAPYFDEPFYVGFNVGGFELGLDPKPATPGASPVAYWGVVNVPEAIARLVDLGGTANEDAQDVGSGIIVGTVRDPWGNVVGLIDNPHFTYGG
jgi:predicted enzyme related to lactoylglutathione lyase